MGEEGMGKSGPLSDGETHRPGWLLFQSSWEVMECSSTYCTIHEEERKVNAELGRAGEENVAPTMLRVDHGLRIRGEKNTTHGNPVHSS